MSPRLQVCAGVFSLAVSTLTLLGSGAHAQMPPPPQPSAAAPAAAPAPAPPAEAKPLPDGHEPTLRVTLDPPHEVRTGEVVAVQISAEARVGDDVTVAEQSFAPFEVHKKRVHVEPPQGDRQRFVFDLALLAMEPGDKPVPAVELRVVTKDGFVGSVKTPPRPYLVRSLLGNEPNAQPKRETKPVVVMQDNYIPIYVAAGLLFAALIAGITLLVSRYLRKRKAKQAPAPPKRPAWEIAFEKLAELRRQKQRMLEEGLGALFVDQVSDAVRQYLGDRHAFDGLETTSDEMLGLLKARNAGVGFTQEVGVFLGRCDLVKFAKAVPDQEEADLIFGKAHNLVLQGQPQQPELGVPPMAAATPGTAPSAALPPAQPTQPAQPSATLPSTPDTGSEEGGQP